MEPLSRYLTDDDLREALAGSTRRVEMWMPHPAYPYLVSNLGGVWSPTTAAVPHA